MIMIIMIMIMIILLKLVPAFKNPGGPGELWEAPPL